MNIYLDESYNLQKSKGKMFISINGFIVLDDQALRKRWKVIRKSYTQLGRRIHATDSYFENLKSKSIKLLGRHDINIVSIFQLTQELKYDYFGKSGIKLDLIYANLLKKLFIETSLGEYRKVKIIIDARTHSGGKLAEKRFQKEIADFLKKQFPNTNCTYKAIPSYINILLELADFVSNTFYREYLNDSEHVFERVGFKLIQIKNPL